VEVAGVVAEEDEATLRRGQLDDRVQDQLEEQRQAQLGVEPLVERQQSAVRVLDGAREASGPRST
jgi:hypothetical protein